MKIGPWTLADEPMAVGAQGELRAAIHDDGRNAVAKIAKPTAASRLSVETERDVLRALTEASVQGVVRWLGDLEVDDRPAFVMSRHGSDLGRWLQQAIDEPGPTTLDEALRYASELASILGRVHAVSWRGGRVVHRDVKPENVLIEGGALALADFGGAIAVDELRAVELSLFGTPMWAPLDQILPGITIPDPTWDTFGVCVLTFAAITGKRPTWQSDPSLLLTERGRALWRAATTAATLQTAERSTAAASFSKMRHGTTAAEIIDPVGRPSLVEADRQALHDGVHRLGRLAKLPSERLEVLERDLWQVLSRGLSPVSHPSPPNRFRDAAELAAQLAELRRRLSDRLVVRPDLLDGPNHELPDIPIDATEEAPRAAGGSGVGPAILASCVAAAAWAAWAWLTPPPAPPPPPPDRVLVATAGAEPFRIDRLEVTGDRWAACVAAGRCAPNTIRGHVPVTGVSIKQASAFCSFEGGTVPTDAQWDAAHGPAPWPWGDAPPDCGRAVALGCADAPIPGGHGATPAGVADLAGNVWEWTTGPSGPRLRGGSVSSSTAELGRAGGRSPVGSEPWAGVRCVYVERSSN